MTSTFEIISPVDGSVYATRRYHSLSEAQSVIKKSQKAQYAWSKWSVQDRAQACLKFLDVFLSKEKQLVQELTWQMGRPITQSPGELRGFEERARYMIEIAPEALSAVVPHPKEGFQREIRRQPLGVVLNLPAWNYPYLTAVNAFIPALMAGNSVVLKHSDQTTLCGERLAESFVESGFPEDVFSILRLDHPTTANLIASSELNYVAFTGSVQGGLAMQKASVNRFIGVGLELGGKDAAYVRSDAPLEQAIETLVDGALFNSGQSCCGIERIYVDESVYDDFVEGCVSLASQYRLGNPLDEQSNLGPLVRTQAANQVRTHLAQAKAKGALLHVDEDQFKASQAGTPYLAPQIVTEVTHDMDLMTQETFGPVVGIMKVKSDQQALQLINDSQYGLTASLWTQDLDRAWELATQIQTGTVFLNRCDYLDPGLAWVGVKNSGRGATLSQVGYESFTRPQSFHFRLP